MADLESVQKVMEAQEENMLTERERKKGRQSAAPEVGTMLSGIPRETGSTIIQPDEWRAQSPPSVVFICHALRLRFSVLLDAMLPCCVIEDASSAGSARGL